MTHHKYTFNEKLMIILGIGMIAIGIDRDTDISIFLEFIKTTIIFLSGILLL